MTTLEKIQNELKKLEERELKEVLLQVKDVVKSRKVKKRRTKSGQGVLEALRAVKTIQGPPDFSRNIDLYLSGEKKVEDHLPGLATVGRARRRS